MPLLDRSGLKADLYTRASLNDVSGHSHALVAWVDLPDALARRSRDQRIGVEVPNTVKAGEIRLVQRQLSLIAIHFPAFGDGRGFSLARQLRNHGFLGTLRAVGPLIADQFAYALACGFDEVEPPAGLLERQPPHVWAEALTRISHGYQRGYGHGGSILDQRRAASKAATRGAAE